MLDKHTFLMELYVMVDDFCQQAPKAEIRPSPVPSLSRSEVVTLSLFIQWQRFRSERDFYLEQLGCHWFMPNEHWTVIPKRQDIAVKIDRLVAPVFKLRDFFGTGGFGAAAPYDPKYDREGRLQFRIRTEDWKRRNGMGGEFHLDGHAGESFNLTHKEVLLAHPEYLASVGGKREWSITAKLDPTNADAVKLWVDDR